VAFRLVARQAAFRALGAPGDALPNCDAPVTVAAAPPSHDPIDGPRSSSKSIQVRASARRVRRGQDRPECSQGRQALAASTRRRPRVLVGPSRPLGQPPLATTASCDLRVAAPPVSRSDSSLFCFPPLPFQKPHRRPPRPSPTRPRGRPVPGDLASVSVRDGRVVSGK